MISRPRRLGDNRVPNIAIIVPARLASTRFPAKPLASIRGADGIVRPAIAYTWAAAKAAAAALQGTIECAVATDDARIADVCRSMGMAVVMTPATCLNGTERCGDAPLTPASMVAAVVDHLVANPDRAMATAVVPATPAVLAHLHTDAAAGRVGGTTAVCTQAGRALYFSKSIIPHVSPGTAPAEPVLLHVGVYAYRPAALSAYVAAGPAPLELQEGLEQLRFLEAGLQVGIARCDAPAWTMIELNNPTDVPLIEAELLRRAQAEHP
ncbi:MAG: hypothetical protein MUC44_03830 [Beijerinckiaceae bacterium]|nr:hypothetical protein [Beijerinckiaceae bacterium]